jgi:hypothetical protein
MGHVVGERVVWMMVHVMMVHVMMVVHVIMVVVVYWMSVGEADGVAVAGGFVTP